MPDVTIFINKIFDYFGIYAIPMIILGFIIWQYTKIFDFFNQIALASNRKIKILTEILDNSHLNPTVKDQLKVNLNELTFKKMTGFHLTQEKIDLANQVYNLLNGKVLPSDIYRCIDYIWIINNKVNMPYINTSVEFYLKMIGAWIILIIFIIWFIANIYVFTSTNTLQVLIWLVWVILTLDGIISCINNYLTGKAAENIKKAIKELE